MRPPFALGWGTVAAIALLLAIVLAALFVSHGPPPGSVSRSPSPPADTVFERCHNGGLKALDDPACQAMWKAAREHFFGQPGRTRP